MKLKIENTHRFFSPVLNQIANLLEKDYEIKFDSTIDSIGGPSFTVIHKKYKYHGLHIKTYLGKNPEWTIQGYYDLPVSIGGVSKYEFLPEMDDENFPLLTDEQIEIIKKKIKAINKRTIMDIKEIGKDIENNQIGQSSSTLDAEHGIDLRGFENYGIVVDYSSFLLAPSPKMINNYRRLQAVINSKDPKVTELIPDMIDMYIEEVRLESADSALKSMRRFDRDIFKLFNQENINNYIAMVKDMFPFKKGYEYNEIDEWVVDVFIHLVDNDSRVKNELDMYFFENTNDDHFLPEDAKEMFLF